MGVSTIGGVGVPLGPPQALYPPTVLTVNPQNAGDNRVSLPPGSDMVIPSGTWMIYTGPSTMLQALDPVSGMWLPVSAYDINYGTQVNSDGTNFRLCNVTGFPIGAIVNNGGTGFTSAPTVTATPGGSTWTAVVGGAISAINIASGGSGANYSVPPIVHIAAPPSPGVQATAVAAISGGAVSSITMLNNGAGYGVTPPVVTLIPQNSEFNLAPTSTAGITNATAVAQLSFVGTVTAVLLVNEGNNPLGVAPALSFTGGAGTGALATAVMAFAVTADTVTTGGSGYAAAEQVTSIGGSIVAQTSGQTANAQTAANPTVCTDMLKIPRPFNQTGVQGSGTGVQVGTILDNGLFTATPTLIANPGPVGASPTAAAVFGVTLGGVNDTSFIHPI